MDRPAGTASFPALNSGAATADRLTEDATLLSDFLLALPMLMFGLVCHEVAHAWTALRQGDPTAWQLGRVTLNPIPHIDPFMTLLLPAMMWFATGGSFVFGGAKPVPVIPRNYRNYVRGDLIVSGAGIVTNLGLALIWVLCFILLGVIHDLTGGAGTSTVTTAQRMLNWGIYLNLLLAFFNLIPIPPLDGSKLLYHALPPRIGAAYRSLDRFGMLPLLVILVFFRDLLTLLLTPLRVGYSQLMTLASPFAVGEEWNIFIR